MGRKKWWDIILAAIICVIVIWRFVFYVGETNGHSGNTVNTAESTAATEAFQPEESEDSQAVQPLETENIYKKIEDHYIEGCCLHNYGEEVRQDDWIYVIREASVSKMKSDNWKYMPDFSCYEYDENFNLLNEYSYLSIKMDITRVDTVMHGEVYLNSMWLGIFDEEGEILRHGELRTADLDKPVTSSYFRCPLEVGETIEVQIVYMVEDKYLDESNYYIIKINNRGVAPQEPNHISLVMIPLGRGVEENENKNNQGM